MHNLADERTSLVGEQDVFRVMFEQAGFGVAQVSLDGRWLAVNQSLCDLLGYSRSDLLHQTLQRVLRFDDLATELTECSRLLRGEVQSFSSQKRHLRGDGRVAWLKATLTLVRDDVTGEPASFLAVVEDRSAQRKALEQVLVEGDNRLRVLTDSISDVFFSLDGDLKCTYWNKAAESLTGISAREMLGKNISDVITEESASGIGTQGYREVLTAQQTRRFDFPCQIGSKDFRLELTAYPSKDGISVVARDVAPARRAAEALQRLAAIVQFNDDAILSMTPDGRIASWNRGAAKLYGYSEEEIVGCHVSLLVPPQLEAESLFIQQSGLAGMGVQGFETQRVTQDGRLVEVSLSISPILDANGAIVGLSSIARNISERKRAEAALKRQVAFDDLMTSLLTSFTTCPASDGHGLVVHALQRTAEFLGVDHAHLLLLSPDRTSWSATHEWCVPELPQRSLEFQNIAMGSIPWSESRILAGEVIRINNIEDYPAEAILERQISDVKAGMQSILQVPIRGSAGSIAGAVGFDSHSRAVVWSDDDVVRCRMVGDAIATLLERKRAEEALRNSEEKFAKAFEASPAIITIVRIKDRCYMEVNRAFEQHTGFSRSEVVGRTLQQVGRSNDLRSLGHAIDTVVTQGSLRNMEARIRRKGGEALIVLLSAEIIEFDGQSCVLTVAEDITERKQAEDALRESEERFRVMADSAPIMMWMASADKRYSDFNRGWLEFTGRSHQEETGEGWRAGIHRADLQSCIATFTAAFNQRQPFSMEYRLRRRDGEYRWIADTGVPRFLPDGDFVGYIGCCVDVDNQKQAELARTDLSRRLMTAQEAERTRIARELHDGIGQSLALLGIQMQRAGQPSTSGKKTLGLLELCGKLKEIGTQVSRLSHQLHSSELEFLGLAVAIKGLCREFSEEYPIAIDCVCTNIPDELDNDVALCFLRIVQEAMHNIAKHSQASQVHIEMTAADGELLLTITDNGIGFEITNIRSSVGLGMISMRERMHLIGGDLRISSKRNGGTRIEARVPSNASA